MRRARLQRGVLPSPTTPESETPPTMPSLPAKEEILMAPVLDRVPSSASERLPTFEQSEFEIILRRQHSRFTAGTKTVNAPSRFSSTTLDLAWELAPWGTTSSLAISPADLQAAEARLEAERRRRPALGQLRAAGIAANSVWGSVYYSLPAVVAVAGALSPISLFVATMLLFLVRPVMVELASALPRHGSAYAYLLNTSTKSVALLGAAVQVVDYCMNSLQASASAAAYIAGEAALPFAPHWLAVLFLVGFAIVGLLGVRENATVASVIASFHVLTMVALMLASAVAWARAGNATFATNWRADVDGLSAARLARRVFDGVCLGLLAMTGFETMPEYAPLCRPGAYRRALRNLHVGAIALNAPLMLFTLALVPSNTILGGYNVLSVLAEVAAGRWLRVWLVVDASIVLSAGVLTGGLSACSLLDRLAHDRVLPHALLRRLPVTHGAYVTQAAFTLLCGAIFAALGGSIQNVGRIFALSFLCVLALFPLSGLQLKFNRGRLPRDSRASLAGIFAALAVLAVVFAGNVALDPRTLAYAAPFAVGIAAILLLLRNRLAVLRALYWVYDQSNLLRRSPLTRRLGPRMLNAMRRLRRRPVVCFVKTDEIHALIRFVLYVKANEPTSHVKLVHVFAATEKVPPDFESFRHVLDEAFPGITLDLVLVHAARFDGALVDAVCDKLGVPTAFAFVGAFGPDSGLSVAELGGARIVTL